MRYLILMMTCGGAALGFVGGVWYATDNAPPAYLAMSGLDCDGPAEAEPAPLPVELELGEPDEGEE
jgi:hypothetical protein